MKLVKARVRGFQSFSDSGDIEFRDGINLVIGQNNSGKSALLRALLPGLPNDPHRSPDKWEAFRLRQPEVVMTIDASGAELKDWILRSNSQQHIPVLGLREEGAAFIQQIFERASLQMNVRMVTGTGVFLAEYPSHRMFNYAPGAQKVFASLSPVNGQLDLGFSVGDMDSLPALLWAAWHREMFYFTAERMLVGEAPAQYAVRLQPNAGNLPNVLHTLRSDREDVFRRLVGHLREVFPTVGNIGVRMKQGENTIEVRLWPTEEMQRVELSFPLAWSGTGVGQVIALLTAIMTIERAVIIIDEINSFLHPAAVKALIRILQTEYSHHQYIISTHAPEVIGFSNPTTIHLIKRAGYESSVERLSLAGVGQFRELAEHLGVSMSDVFAADRVIWVEGPTEEMCFPYIYQRLVGPLVPGTVFTSVVATGDFNSNRRDKELVYQIYQQLSEAVATLANSIVFSFDTEKLTDEEKTEMERNSRGLVYFLPRRHFECYLVDSAAIASLIISKDPASEHRVTATAVEAAIREVAATRPLLTREWDGDVTKIEWLARVDAANLISEVCRSLSEERARFNKKADSLFLLKYILEHNADSLEPLKLYISSLIDAVEAARIGKA